ncbi:MAG: nucleoside deaminase [Firmicutes bacterium]|nr:nucleoside deaminase [Bacillota bacterium]
MNIDYMHEALKEAEKAAKKGEVPVGCVIVHRDKIIARAHNLKEKKRSATKHAEIIAIEKASKKLKSWRLLECDIYVTLEPCAMCAGAIINARIQNLYYGAPEQKFGCAGSVYNLFADNKFNHLVNVQGGIETQQSAKLLKDFFLNKRK